MTLQIDAPQSAPPAAVQPAPAENAHMLAASENVALTVTRQNASEAPVVRYSLWTRTELTAAAPPIGLDGILCRWKLTAQLQRDYCIRSLTGRFACTESIMVPLAEREDGQTPLPAGAAAGCSLNLASVAEARLRFAKAIADTRAQRVNADLAETLIPELRAGGFTVRRR